MADAVKRGDFLVSSTESAENMQILAGRLAKYGRQVIACLEKTAQGHSRSRLQVIKEEVGRMADAVANVDTGYGGGYIF